MEPQTVALQTPSMNSIVPSALISQKIFFVRGTRVMLDADLARLYGVATKNLNKAVKRNASRFPEVSRSFRENSADVGNAASREKTDRISRQAGDH